MAVWSWPAEAMVFPSGEHAMACIGWGRSIRFIPPWSSSLFLFDALSQSSTVLLNPPVANMAPSGEKTTARACFGRTATVAVAVSLARSQNLTVPSWPAVARVFSSGEKVTHSIQERCPTGIGRDPPEARSHGLTVLSHPLEARVFESDENDRESTERVCSLYVSRRARVSRSQTLIWPSRPQLPPPTASSLPSGEKARQ